MDTITYETKNYIFKTIDNINFYKYTKETKEYIKTTQLYVNNILDKNIFNFNI